MDATLLNHVVQIDTIEREMNVGFPVKLKWQSGLAIFLDDPCQMLFSASHPTTWNCRRAYE